MKENLIKIFIDWATKKDPELLKLGHNGTNLVTVYPNAKESIVFLMRYCSCVCVRIGMNECLEVYSLGERIGALMDFQIVTTAVTVETNYMDGVCNNKLELKDVFNFENILPELVRSVYPRIPQHKLEELLFRIVS
jgi:hypothetical protein